MADRAGPQGITRGTPSPQRTLVIVLAQVVTIVALLVVWSIDRDSDFLTTTAIVELVMAVLLFLVASAIMSGPKWARLAVAIVVGLRLAVVSYFLITHLGGGMSWNAIVAAGDRYLGALGPVRRRPVGGVLRRQLLSRSRIG